MKTDMDSCFLLNRLVHASARFLDDRDYDGYLSLFSEQGEYLISSRAPELARPMIWMQQSREELRKRIQAIPEHEWEIMQVEQTRIISFDICTVDGNQAHSSSSFVIYHSDEQGRSRSYALGRYEDNWHQCKEQWLLERREVVLKTRQLDMLSPLPL